MISKKKTTGLSMPQTRKMNSKKKETMHSTKRWLFATLLHSYHSSLPTYVSCTFMQARDIKFLPNFFPDPITDLRFPPRWKSKPPNQIKNKKKPFVKILPATLVPTGIPITRYVSPACALFLFLVLPPFPQRKGNRSNVGSDPIAK